MRLGRIGAALRQRSGRLGPRDRRALVLGLWLVGPALGYVWIARPIAADFASTRERLASERDLLNRERSLLAEAAGLPARLSAAADRLSGEKPRLFSGTDPVSAAASLARHVSDRAARHRVMVQGSETQPAESLGGAVLQLGVQLRAIGDLAGVTAWLADLESGPRLLRVEELRIAPADRAGPDDSEEEVLGVTLWVTGFAWADSAGGTPLAGGTR